MAITISDLNATENYDDGTVLTEAQLNTMVASIETYANVSLKLNLIQLAKDAFPEASYAFTSDGVKAITSTLWDKQYVDDYYDSGDITIGTSADVAYAAVDAVNAIITITPEMAGKYKATFYFTHEATSSATSLMAVDVSFRITDGTTASQPINSGGTLAAPGSGSSVLQNAVTLVHVFNFTSLTAKTITLQKFVRTASNVSTNLVNASSTTGGIYMVVEKI